MTEPLHLLAIAGSLRLQSTNRTLLMAAAALAPPELRVTSFIGLGELPHFDADLEADGLRPRAVEAWRDLVARADGLLISVPEYAGGIPGSFKNALDWLVGDPRFDGKLVAILNASQRSVAAQDALRLVLRTMSAQLVEEASATIPLLGTSLNHEAVVQQERFAEPIRRSLQAFAARLRSPDVASVGP